MSHWLNAHRLLEAMALIGLSWLFGPIVPSGTQNAIMLKNMLRKGLGMVKIQNLYLSLLTTFIATYLIGNRTFSYSRRYKALMRLYTSRYCC